MNYFGTTSPAVNVTPEVCREIQNTPDFLKGLGLGLFVLIIVLALIFFYFELNLKRDTDNMQNPSINSQGESTNG